jgi:hypothetical protein
MANRAYLSIWTKDFSEQTMIAEFARFLTTAPISAGEVGFKELTVQAVDATETPVAEWDLRERGYGPAEVAALAAQHLNQDTAYLVEANWDLWAFDMDTLKWQQGPQAIEFICRGPAYDDGAAASDGQLSADLGFEHFFTGHAGLLAPGYAANPFDNSDHPVEKTFRQWMTVSENRKEYASKTRENIQQLFAWVESIERALPIERTKLWSEGEENFEARLDAILAQR